MNYKLFDKLVQNCLTMLKQQYFKESMIKRHQRHLLDLKNYMKEIGQRLYDFGCKVV